MAGELFDGVGRELAGPPGAGGAAEAAPVEASGGVYTAPARTGGIGSRDDFVKGIAVGAGLVLLGVFAGAVVGRRR
jgi:uncharacterized protein